MALSESPAPLSWMNMSLGLLRFRLLTDGIVSRKAATGALIVEAAGDQAYTAYKRLHPNTKMTRQEYMQKIADAKRDHRHHADRNKHHGERAGHHYKQHVEFGTRHLRLSDAQKHGTTLTGFDSRAKHHKELHSQHKRRATHHRRQAENHLRRLNKLQNPG